MEIKNTAICFYLELDVFKGMSVSVVCRFGLAENFLFIAY